MKDFKVALQAFGLFDMGYKGHIFTWRRGQNSSSLIQECLDRALASAS